MNKHRLCINDCAAEGLELELRRTQKQLRRAQREIGLMKERLRVNVRAVVKEEMKQNG